MLSASGQWSIGGFFLYVSYYGCDQSQAQRLLTSEKRTGKLPRPFSQRAPAFPIHPTLLPVSAWSWPSSSLSIRILPARVPAQHPDYLPVPMFVMQYMPTGVVGIVMAAIFAASHVQFRLGIQFYERRDRKKLLGGKRGMKTCGLLRRFNRLAFASLYRCMGRIVHRRRLCDEPDAADPDRADQHDRIGVYGPTLAVFSLGLLKRAGESGVLWGLAAGVGDRRALWLFTPGVSWLWWNVTGLAVALVVGN